MADRLDRLTPQLFLDGPTEFLSKNIALQIIAESHFSQIFSDSVVPYDKEDFSIRELPALRVYNREYTKEHESHYIFGDIYIDLIMPPSLRRDQTEEMTGQIAAALLQQFRRPRFFLAMLDAVPGLNELGKVFRVDRTLTYQNTKQDDECPVTQIKLNFRIDLKAWDTYLENTGRTKDDPFDVTLANLRKIATTIQGIKETSDLETEKQIKIDSNQKAGG